MHADLRGGRRCLRGRLRNDAKLELGGEIDKLIKEMEASIAEADQFIAEIQPKKA